MPGARIGDYFYLFGGEDIDGSLRSIERSTIAADGSLGELVVSLELV